MLAEAMRASLTVLLWGFLPAEAVPPWGPPFPLQCLGGGGGGGTVTRQAGG